jgi:hypothetical protein
MAFAFSYDVPGDPQMYAAVKGAIGPAVPEGLIVQLVVQAEHGLRHVMVWEAREHWERFRTSRVEPAVRQVLASSGISAPSAAPAITPVRLVDVWVPGPVPAARP